MNTRHHIASVWFTLLLLVLPAPVVLAQVPSDSVVLPEGLEATGDTAEVRALIAWAEEHQQAHPEQAAQLAERALALARSLNDQQAIGRSLISLADFASDLNETEAYYTEAREMFEQVGNERGLVRIQLGMGNVYIARGELEQALRAYFNALEGFERLGDREGEARALTNIGITQEEQDNMREALVYYERAVTVAETLDEPALHANILINFGLALSKEGVYERAEDLLRRALAISEERGYRRYAIASAINLGFLFNQQTRYEQALPFLFTAERLSKESREDAFLPNVYDELGRTYLGLGRYNQALRYGNESLQLAQSAESFPQQMVAHETLSRIHEAIGNSDQALAHHRQYAAARDSVFTAEKAGIVAQMQTRYETEKKQLAIERLEQENRIRALQLILLLGAIAVALLIAGLFYYRYRLKHKENRLLEDLDAAKSRFFANISHEFRTPLTVILGSMQDALAGRFGKTTEKLIEQHQAVLRNTHRLQGLIDEVLDLNRLEAGKLELNLTPGDLVRSLRRLVETDAPLAERNGIELTFDHDVEHCPRYYDEEKLEKIVGNLLSNALKFTPKGGAVHVELHGNDPVEIAVSDTGPGIPEEAQRQVFDRFAQVEDGSHHSGTGIGLALAKELAELHGGTITLESTPGKGSTFTVRLPLKEAFREDVVEATQSVADSNRSETVLDDGVGATLVVAQQTEETDDNPDRTTVLIIEDNDDVRAYVRRSLEETYRVLEAADGETGLQQARTELPDLIVSDVMLPGIDGYEIARRLKTEPVTECISLVMLTARAAEEDQAEGYGSGAEVYITKPFSPGTLRAAVARLLEERRRLRRRLEKGTTKGAGEERSINGHPTLSDRLRAVILENLHDEDFGIDELAVTLGMSRTVLYDDLQEEGGLTPAVMIRTTRLEKARELLANGAGSVSEVACAVGFKSLSHFTRSFREHYGELPSSVLDAR